MDLLIWIAVVLRVLRAALPTILTVGLALLVMGLAGTIPAAFTIPTFLFLVALIGCFLKNHVFGGEHRPDPRYREYPQRRRYISRNDRV